MKKFAIITLCSLSLYLIFLSFGGFYPLLAFIIAGAIPGTSLILSSQAMFAASIILSGIVIFRVGGYALRKLQKYLLARNRSNRLPKRRFSHI